MSPSTVLNPKMLFLSSFLMMMRSDGSLKMSLMFFPVSAIFVMLFCFLLPGSGTAWNGGYCFCRNGRNVLRLGRIARSGYALSGAAAPDAEFPEWLRLIRNVRMGCALDGVGWFIWTGTSSGRQVPRISHVHGGRLHRRG